MTDNTNRLNRLQETQKLYILARNRDPDSRAKLGSAITDLFADPPLTLREQEIVSDILMSLLLQAERDLKQAVADRLAALTNAPLRVILFLSNEDIDIARPVITRSPVLTDSDLMFIIQTHKSPHWQAVATRPDLKSQVIETLVGTGDVSTARVLVGNRFITIPRTSLEVLVNMARDVRDLQTGLLDRDDIPADLTEVLYKVAAETVTRAAQMIDPHTNVQDVVEDTADEYIRAARDDFMPSPQMIQAAQMLAGRGQLNLDSMMKALKNGQIASYIAQMMVFLEVDFAAIDRMLKQPNGELLAAFCRVSRGDKRIFLQMFLMTERYRGGDRMVDSSALNTALMTYDQINFEKGTQILKTLRTAQ